MELWKDGALLATDTASPYSFSWNTTLDTNASHTLETKAYDAAGNVGNSTSVSVTVNNTVTPPLPTATLSAFPASITTGQSSTLTWNSTNATSCTGNFVTNNLTSGSTAVSPTVTTPYSINCSGATDFATVTVSSITPSFGIGSCVKTTANLNVRDKANTKGGKILCTQPLGSLGTILSGPTGQQGSTWWNINFDTLCDGYSIQDYLALVTVAQNTPSINSGQTITHTLAKGWSGPEVFLLQSMLQKIGIYSGEITGYFGSATEQAVKDFQSQNNLSAVGIVGPLTLELLNGMGQ